MLTMHLPTHLRLFPIKNDWSYASTLPYVFMAWCLDTAVIYLYPLKFTNMAVRLFEVMSNKWNIW
jgi:hypothetical protein